MNSLDLLRISKLNFNESSKLDKWEDKDSSDLKKIFEQMHIMTSLVLRFQQRSISEISDLREGSELKIKTSRIEVLNNYKLDSSGGKQMGYFDELNIPVDVTIGQIELSVNDLLAIEKGAFLVSKLLPQSKIALLIAGEKIAEASFEVEDEMITLKINEIFLKRNDEISDNKVVTAV